jgi:hypothetical protein
MDLVQLEDKDKIVDTEINKAKINLLTRLYYQTCNCLVNNKRKTGFLNPKFHRKTCLYKKYVEEDIKMEFENE